MLKSPKKFTSSYDYCDGDLGNKMMLSEVLGIDNIIYYNKDWFYHRTVYHDDKVNKYKMFYNLNILYMTKPG